MRQKGEGASFLTGMTPVFKELLFDYPKTFEKLDQIANRYNIHSNEALVKAGPEVQFAFARADKEPFWHGIYSSVMGFFKRGQFSLTGPLFEKISEGQVWRVFTPALLHRDLLHILFNLSWFFFLGLQVEKRIKFTKFWLLVLTLAAVSNTAQYLMSGLYFLGISGVVVGLVGFIWSRQRCAPEESYPLSRSSSMFVFYFVLGMAAFAVITFTLQLISNSNYGIPIANTAHLAGGISGILLGHTELFARKKA